jgi:opacity protein-like surface antigen
MRGLAFAAALAALALPATIARAGWMPDWTATAGATTAISGVPDEGGFAMSVSPMWPVHGPVSFGVMIFADDMGAEIGQMLDPNDGTDLGAVAEKNTWVTGAAWRLDGEWGSITSWMPFASGTLGWYRVIDDHDGTVSRALSSVGFSLGGGVRFPLSERQALGASVRYNRLLNDRIGRYVTLSMDWSYR